MADDSNKTPVSDYDYEYPEELVAQSPLASRDKSRMMLINRGDQSIGHLSIKDLPSRVQTGDIVVINDSRVIPARIFGTKSNGEAIELLVIEPRPNDSGIWNCLLKRARRTRKGDKFFFGMQSTATVAGMEDGFLLVEFKGNALSLAMKHHGVPPLPPYIKREGFKAYTEDDRERYQTVYASKAGSAAAPTAGLHLSEKIISEIKNAGATIASVTLHVGIDTFAPMRAKTIGEHKMHGERVEISEETARTIESAKRDGRRIIAVGTTSVRALESAALQDGKIRSGEWTTDIFINEGYEFKLVSAMLTNFHQPRSTLIMLVSAFAGKDLIKRAYANAIENRYRLFSYGDCMFIE